MLDCRLYDSLLFCLLVYLKSWPNSILWSIYSLPLTLFHALSLLLHLYSLAVSYLFVCFYCLYDLFCCVWFYLSLSLSVGQPSCHFAELSTWNWLLITLMLYFKMQIEWVYLLIIWNVTKNMRVANQPNYRWANDRWPSMHLIIDEQKPPDH